MTKEAVGERVLAEELKALTKQLLEIQHDKSLSKEEFYKRHQAIEEEIRKLAG